MDKSQIEQFDNDIRIISIGGLFRNINGSRWFVNIGFYPHQKRKYLGCSHMPILARQRTLNATKTYDIRFYKKSITLGESQDWEVDIIANCPALSGLKLSDEESRQKCFVIHTGNQECFYLPQLELARALFLHDSYLSRAALESGALDNEFYIEYDQYNYPHRIHVLPISTYPLKSLHESGLRRILCWILADKNVRQSFESIAQREKAIGFNNGNYRKWDFEFIPPDLMGVVMGLRGRWDKNSKTMFVHEISSVRNLMMNLPNELEVFHSKFKESVKGKGVSGVGEGIGLAEEQIIDDDETANINSPTRIMLAQPVTLNFINPIKTIKVAKKKQLSAAGRLENELSFNKDEYVSVDEATVYGELPNATWSSAVDVSNDAHLYANKFDCFLQMIDKLESIHGCKIVSKCIRKLPFVSLRYSMHLLNDGNPRCISVVHLQYKDNDFYLIEIDVSDNAKPLSTQLLSLKNSSLWESQLIEIEKKIIKGSIKWPKNYLNEICGAGRHNGMPHPQTASENKAIMKSSEVDRWSDRVVSWMDE